MQSRMGSFGLLEDGLAPQVRIINQTSKHLLLKLLIILFFLGGIIIFSYINMSTSHYITIQSLVPISQPRIEECIQEPKSIKTWIRPPTSLIRHEMNDSELFWRASFVPMIKEYPFKRTPKIAFMFLTRGDLPMAPLWERFFKGNERLYSVYVHSSPSHEPDFSTSSIFCGRQIPGQVTEWGKMSMCDAERRLLASALLDISNEWFVLLSEACIPLRNFSTVYNYISRSHFSFMGSFGEPGHFGQGSYNDKMLPEVNLSEWRKGSQWFEINRKLAIDIIQDSKYYPKFEQFCKPHHCYVDEHYFPTMLSIQSPHLLANRTLMWVDWSRGGPHPTTFEKSDVMNGLFDRIFRDNRCMYNNQSIDMCYLFARKFAPSVLDLLLEHSSKIFGFE